MIRHDAEASSSSSGEDLEKVRNIEKKVDLFSRKLGTNWPICPKFFLTRPTEYRKIGEGIVEIREHESNFEVRQRLLAAFFGKVEHKGTSVSRIENSVVMFFIRCV